MNMSQTPLGIDTTLAAQASGITVGELLRVQARMRPEAPAVVDRGRTWSYGEFNARVNRLAHALAALGLQRGERIAILSENRSEYLELAFAAAKLGLIFCALNWRLTQAELLHCIRLTTPKAALVSERFAHVLSALEHGCGTIIELGADYEKRLAAQLADEPDIAAQPEDGLVIIYTSGTTGLPKGALISHRAEIARLHVNCLDFDLDRTDAFVAWPPLFHMVSTDQSISLLSIGGKVIVIDGFDVDRILESVQTERQWWLVLMPGMIDQVIHEIRGRSIRPKGIKLIGAMADLVPRAQIAEITHLLQAPYANTFGSTETGIPPMSGGRIAVGETPTDLSKSQNSLCEFRLVDAEDRDMPDGTPGELAFRGPTLFSGYWNAPEANTKDFRGGWFHMGDMFIRRPDGKLDFVDRAKYLIKSGGENIYPAEIERVLLADRRVADAVVVRSPDARWGEVPVAFVARRDDRLTADDLAELCRRELAGYKRPKDIRFVAFDALPRSTTGKIQRHEVERWLRQDRAQG